jgi:predicted nucleic acid-binding Zn ribbon protein
MKKQSKAKAVKKGTFYECLWCGKEGTNAPCYSVSKKVVCGRAVEIKKKYFCSDKCQHIYTVENNRREVIEGIDFANKGLDLVKNVVGASVEVGIKIAPSILHMAKLLNIYKKVLTLIISGDKPSARKLYDEKKETVTDCTEDLLADKLWGDFYMFFINRFAELDGVLSDDCSI